MTIVYEPEYSDTGWFDHGAYRGATTGPVSWFWRDLTDDAPITLTFLEPVFFIDLDDIKLLDGGPGTPVPGLPDGSVGSGITVQVIAGFFDDPDGYFVPIAIRALIPGNQALKNEVRRIR